MKRFVLALDLVDDPELIAAYEHWHRSENCWPEIKQNIKDGGIVNMEIYRAGNRLFMLIEAGDDFSFEKKAAADAANPSVQKWEALMWKFQQPLPWAKEGAKWTLMDKIFQLD
jgi:L-rhamnose mutarotase